MRSLIMKLLLAALVLSVPALGRAAEGTKGNPIGAKGSKFAKNHPARNKDNKQVANQRARIDQGVKNGTMTRGQAKADRAKIRAVKTQEHADVRSDPGGHLTSGQQKSIHQELNDNSQQIHDQKNPQ